MIQHTPSSAHTPSGQAVQDTVYIKDYTPDAFSHMAYDSSYSKLRRWIDDSLDVFKTELKEILFPIFEHCYMDLIAKGMITEARQFFDSYKSDHIAFNANDLQQLESITSPTHFAHNTYAQVHRSNKYCVPMARTTFQLLISYIEDNGFVALLRILNQYVDIDMHTTNKFIDSAKTPTAGTEAAGVLGISTNLHLFNAQSVSLGVPPIPAHARDQIQAALLKEQDTQPSFLSLFQKLHQQPTDSPTPSIPLPPIRHKQVQEYVEVVRDLAHRAHLNATTLPSICMYTWHNTYDCLNVGAVSADATLAAAGFSDSVIRIHSLTQDPLRAVVAPPAGISSDSIRESWTIDQLDGLREPVGTPCKRLIGHQAAVFGVSFAPDNKFLVSCSEDHTARLWSLDTFDNVACYRGHNFPVWDVDIGPEGHYFATASHDRTARLWSPEYIFPLRIFAGHLSDVDVVKFHPNSNYIATGSSDKTVRLWDVNSGNCVRVFTGHGGPVQALAFSPDGRFLATAGDDRNVHLFDIHDGRRIKKMTGDKSVVSTLAFSQEGALLASGSLDGAVRLWDVLRKNTDNDGASEMGTADAKKKRKTRASSIDLIDTFYTLQTPVVGLVFTRRNLLLATGAYNASTAIV